MQFNLNSSARLLRWTLFAIGMAAILAGQALWRDDARVLNAQQPAKNAASETPEIKAERDLAAAKAKAAPTPVATETVASNDVGQSLWDLFLAGGIFMWPIAAFSFVVVAYGIERAIALRAGKVVPNELVQGLGEMSAQGGFDPRKAYRLCQEYPSSLANVVRAILLKVGRPHSEVEEAAKEAKDSEATKLYGNVRHIALSQTVAPMLGLLGTVQGIIMAFGKISDTTQAANVNKFNAFAEGIYTALITTFAGLVVAIPAAILCHYFEGLINARFERIDDVLSNLMPQVERYEGKLRVNRDQLSATPTAQPVATPPAVIAPPVVAKA